MDKKKLIALLQDKKVQDYSFMVFFFLVFSIFVFFAIRPNILTAFKLQQELQELRLKNQQAEDVIMQIVNYQSIMENYRDKLPLLEQALPSTPGLAKAVDDVRKTAAETGLELTGLSIDSMEFSDSRGKGEIQTFNMSVSSSVSTEQLAAFLTALFTQRRVKSVDTFDLAAGSDQTITISFVIKTYYL